MISVFVPHWLFAGILNLAWDSWFHRLVISCSFIYWFSKQHTHRGSWLRSCSLRSMNAILAQIHLRRSVLICIVGKPWIKGHLRCNFEIFPIVAMIHRWWALNKVNFPRSFVILVTILRFPLQMRIYQWLLNKLKSELPSSWKLMVEFKSMPSSTCCLPILPSLPFPNMYPNNLAPRSLILSIILVCDCWDIIIYCWCVPPPPPAPLFPLSIAIIMLASSPSSFCLLGDTLLPVRDFKWCPVVPPSPPPPPVLC